MRVKPEKKVPKIPRNFRLDAAINEKLIACGETFKDGDRIGDTGVVEAALEAYFSRNNVSSATSTETPEDQHRALLVDAWASLKKKRKPSA